jgi:hypothetical protein
VEAHLPEAEGDDRPGGLRRVALSPETSG